MPKQTVEEVETPLINLTLPVLMGRLVERALLDPRTANQCAHDLAMWHDAQPLESRPDQIKANKKVIENAKLLTEFLFQQYVQIAQKDMP